tara:strand:+ start:57850 stop:59019 length:1170 start_codon:yes stop_codon:yes gene_type:complete
MREYIYLDKGYHENVSDKLYEQIKDNRGIIINLDEEGAVDYPDNSTLLNRYSAKMFEKVDFIFLWGNNQYDLVKERINRRNRVIVSGHPRFELLKNKYHIFYEEEANRIKKKYGNFILINTNMGFGNNIRGDSFVINNYGVRFKNIKRIIEFDKNKIKVIKSLVMKLAKDLDKKIVIRAHPEENINYYNDIVDHNSVNAVYEGSVIPWLIAAEMMIHPDCTTAIESLMLGKKSVSYLPQYYDENLVTKLPLEASYKFSDPDELMRFINNKIYLDEDIKLDEYKFLHDNFSFFEDSSRNIVNNISQLINQSYSIKDNNLLINQRLILIYKSLRSMIRNNKSSMLGNNKRKGFNYSNIKNIKEQFNNFNNEFKHVLFNRISNELFLFYHAS